MKKYLLILLFTVTSFSCFCQTHMTFKGVPIDGTITEFESKMLNEGFTTDPLSQELLKTHNSIIMHGAFAGEEVELFILSSPNTKIVWKVAAFFKKNTEWYSLKSDYNKFKDSYSKKYGKPISYEFFSDPYDEGDGYEMQAIRLGKCSYLSVYTSDEGEIIIKIDNNEQIVISYEDSINSNIYSREKESVVMEDI